MASERTAPRLDPDQAAVHGMGVVGHRPHEQEVARGPGRQVVLESSEVEHLVVPSDEGGSKETGPRHSDQGRVGPQSGVAPSEGHREALECGIGADDTGLVAQYPGRRAEGLQADEGQLGVVRDTHLGDRHHQGHRTGWTRTGDHRRSRAGGVGQQGGAGAHRHLHHAGRRPGSGRG